MKKLFSTAVTVSLAAITLTVASPLSARADNPCIQTIYSTDPAPMVYNDTVYVYTGRDKDNSDFYYMPDWHCYSSKDMQNWTDHGTLLSWNSFTWGKEDTAWASQCIERNGKFYYYVTLEHKNGGGRGIGVAVADSPTGPFKDALGRPLCGPDWDYIDPTVFIDDDGQAWLMFGNPTCYYVKLKEDMTTLDGQIGHFNMNSSTFGPGGGKASSYGEGPWFYKRGDLYYLVFAAFYNGEGSESIGYSTAPSPTGPWTYRGQVMRKHNCFTNHPGVIDFKGHSYLFYHDASLPGGGDFDRSVCVDEFQYGSDGSIPTISPSKTGPKQIASLDPYKKVEAETICFSSGVKTEKCDNGGMNISNIRNGSYVKVSGVDFGNGADSFTANVAASGNGGDIEIYLDSLTGKKIGTCAVPTTGGWQNWEEVSCNVSGASGEHDLYFKFTGGNDYLFNIDWWKFSGDGSSSTVTTTTSTAPGDGTTTTTTVPPSDPDGYLLHWTFEGSSDNWEGRGRASVAASSKEACKGSGSLYCSGREDSWNGAMISLGSSISAGKTYSFSANVMQNEGTDSEKFYLTMQYSDGSGTNYEKIANASPMKGKWAQLANRNFTVPSGASDISIYVETESGTTSFYVDEAAVASAGTVIEGAVGGQFILGDLNSDGVINSLDMTAARKLILSSRDASLVKLADVDRSTELEVNDIVLLQQFILGIIKEFPDNTPEPQVTPFNYDSNKQYKEAPGSYFNRCQQQGKVIKESYNGINGGNNLNVYLPYGYDDSKQYNIFYLMHGGGENENTLIAQDDTMIQNMLDHMIMNGELDPLIVVFPTFNKTEAGRFYSEFRQSVVPFVEGKYSTYAKKDTSQSSLQSSRMHRAYGGFSMGSISTWAVFENCLDIVGYYMPLSGENRDANSAYDRAKLIADAVDKSGFKKNQYFIFAATGSEDIAYPNFNPQIEEMKKMSQFVYTSDFSKGNFYFMVAPGATHWWGYVRHYVYDALPYFFHETGT